MRNFGISLSLRVTKKVRLFFVTVEPAEYESNL